MFIRCVTCRVAVKIESLPSEEEAQIRCTSCGNRNHVKPGAFSGLSIQQVQETARRLADQNELDLPSAVSVVLGADTLARMKEWRQSVASAVGSISVAPHSEEATDEGSSRTREQPLKMKETQADVNRRADLLTKDHDLPRSLARRVAAGEMSLREALRRRPKPKAEEQPSPAGHAAAARQYKIIAVVVAVIVVLIGLQSRARWNARVMEGRDLENQIALARQALPAKPDDQDQGSRTHEGNPLRQVATPDAIPGIDIARSADGRPTKISGPNPRAVLEAWCASGVSPHGCEAIEVITPPAAGARSRVGLFRDPSSPGAVVGIRIAQDRKQRRWFAGTGAEPIEDSIAWLVTAAGVVALQAPSVPPNREAVPDAPRRGYGFTGKS